jgi:hypothetical protein
MTSCGIGKKDIKPQKHEGTEIRKIAMEQIINIHIEKLPKGLYLARQMIYKGLLRKGGQYGRR